MKIVICGNYGATNLGDDAILEGILKLVGRHNPNAQVSVIGRDIPRLPLGIRSLLRGGYSQTLQKIKQCDLFILGGGGLFVDTKFRAPLIWGLHAFTAHHYGKPIYLFSNSLGPLKTPLGKWITKKVLKWCKIVSFRDTASIKLAQKLLPDKKYKFVPDPAFALKPQKSMGEGKIIISLRDWTKKVNNATEEIPQIINKITANNRLEVLLVPFQVEGEEDISLLNNICEQCRSSLYEKQLSPQTALNLFSGSKLVVGMRLHSLIFGAITGTPIIGINYSPKVKNFMSDLGLAEYVLEPEEIDKLPELIEKALKNSPRIKAELSHKTEELRRLLYSSSLKLSL
ncbi:MAG: polysaccharide pyruvyl transferase family protein [Patescibacteria group bacterium]|nr:polysaccharide pyruvyl transferase family protein [Patescibacteria group bacterium]